MKILGHKTIRITLNFSYCTFIWEKKIKIYFNLVILSGWVESKIIKIKEIWFELKFIFYLILGRIVWFHLIFYYIFNPGQFIFNNTLHLSKYEKNNINVKQ